MTTIGRVRALESLPERLDGAAILVRQFVDLRQVQAKGRVDDAIRVVRSPAQDVEVAKASHNRRDPALGQQPCLFFRTDQADDRVARAHEIASNHGSDPAIRRPSGTLACGISLKVRGSVIEAATGPLYLVSVADR